MLRHRADWVPVFDLAGARWTPGPSEESLYLIVKHPDGPFATQIDAIMPMLKMVEPSAIRPVDDQPQPGHSASCVVGGEEWPLYSFCQLIRG